MFCFIQILDSQMAALVAMGSGPVLSNKQMATTGQIKISLSFQKQLTVTVHACRSAYLWIVVVLILYGGWCWHDY